jgi:hypothetical protein
MSPACLALTVRFPRTMTRIRSAMLAPALGNGSTLAPG